MLAAGRTNKLRAPYIQPAKTPTVTSTSMFTLRFFSDRYAPLYMRKPAIHTTGVDTAKTARLTTFSPPITSKYITAAKRPKSVTTRSPRAATAPIKCDCYSALHSFQFAFGRGVDVGALLAAEIVGSVAYFAAYGCFCVNIHAAYGVAYFCHNFLSECLVAYPYKLSKKDISLTHHRAGKQLTKTNDSTHNKNSSNSRNKKKIAIERNQQLIHSKA